MSFITCWLVVPLLGCKVTFTLLGVASGLFWVVGAMAGIYGIQNAGLALSVGIWCSLNVLTSCYFGVFVFKEHVKSFYGMIILVVGFVGMSRYAGPENKVVDVIPPSKIESDEENTMTTIASDSDDSKESNEMIDEIITENYEYAGKDSSSSRGPYNLRGNVTRRLQSPQREMKPFNKCINDDGRGSLSYKKRKRPVNFNLSRRQCGILGAIVNGTFGACKYIPMHYAR